MKAKVWLLPRHTSLYEWESKSAPHTPLEMLKESSRVCADQNRYLKPKHDLFWTLTTWFLCPNWPEHKHCQNSRPPPPQNPCLNPCSCSLSCFIFRSLLTVSRSISFNYFLFYNSMQYNSPASLYDMTVRGSYVKRQKQTNHNFSCVCKDTWTSTFLIN